MKNLFTFTTTPNFNNINSVVQHHTFDDSINFSIHNIDNSLWLFRLGHFHNFNFNNIKDYYY